MKVEASFLLLSWCVAATASVALEEDTRPLHQPDVSGGEIVFVYGNDLWTVPVTGGTARRLTSHRGVESHPKFSPDGTKIAFSGEYEGNTDVYVIPTQGGEPRRLTYHPDDDEVQGWSPDGSKILFRSRRASNHYRFRLHTIDAQGGYPKDFPMHKAFMGAFSPDGKKLAFTPNRNPLSTWKRYRGGETSPLWIVDLESFSHTEIPHENASDLYPVWIVESVFFLSDRNDVLNVFRYNTQTGEVKEIVNNGYTDIDHLAGNAEHLVYTSGGFIYLYDIASGIPMRVAVFVPDDRAETTPRYKDVSQEIRWADISPDGSHALFEAHGEIVTVSLKEGAVRNVSRSPGSHERYPAWSPDGNLIACFSDASGEYALHIANASGNDSATSLPLEEPGFFYGPVWAPDNQKVAYTDKYRSLWYVDIPSKTHEKLGGYIDSNDTYVWSPDSRWVACSNRSSTLMRSLKLYSLDSGKSYPITDGMGDAYNPAFGRDGRYLFFLGSTSSGQIKTGLDLSVFALRDQVTWEIYAVLLRKDHPSPFAPQLSDTMPKEDTSQAQTTAFRIDREGIDQRLVRLPIPPGRYTNLQSADEGVLFFLERPSEPTPNGAGYKLRRFAVEEKKIYDFLENVQDYKVSADGKTILYSADNQWSIVATSGKPDPASGKLDLSSMKILVEPIAEWSQMFVEAWRKNRDFFYDEDMHGIDWDSMRLRYQDYLPDLKHRSDLNWLIQKLLSELVNSHVSVGGGDIPQIEAEPVGLLGADYEVADGRYRIKRILATSCWDNDEERSPLSTPGLGVDEGDFILEVNGRDLKYPTNIFSLFAGTVGNEVVLRVNAEPILEGSRQVIVVPLKRELALRRRAWIEHNRKIVDRLSRGAIAYVYQPDTGTASIREFNRYFFPQSDRQAAIIDERFNDGGDDPDYQLDILDRQQLHWYVERNTPPFTSPFSMIAGPKVMIVNAEAGSGGDVYPYQFKLRGLGVTVGTRTWGGVMGGGRGPLLMDGGYASAPDLGTYSPEGDYILENSGHQPDHEVYIYPKDDHEGRDPQLEKAVELLLEKLRENPPQEVPDFERVDRALKSKER